MEDGKVAARFRYRRVNALAGKGEIHHTIRVVDQVYRYHIFAKEKDPMVDKVFLTRRYCELIDMT